MKVTTETAKGPILLDAPLCDDTGFDISFLERNQHPVIVCHGPEPEKLCPLLAEGACAKYEAARGVIFELDLDRPQHRAILTRYRDLDPTLPIRVLVRADQAERFRELLTEVEVWTHAPTAADLDGFAAEVEAVDR